MNNEIYLLIMAYVVPNCRLTLYYRSQTCVNIGSRRFDFLYFRVVVDSLRPSWFVSRGVRPLSMSNESVLVASLPAPLSVVVLVSSPRLKAYFFSLLPKLIS